MNNYGTNVLQAIERIDELVRTKPVVAFVRGTAEQPMCQGSADLLQMLAATGRYFHAVDVRQDPELRAFLPRYSTMTALPQLFVDGELVGGVDVAQELDNQGELKRMCADANARLPRTA